MIKTNNDMKLEEKARILKLQGKKLTQWNLEKLDILEKIKKAYITNEKAIKLILAFLRRINTLRNMRDNGSSWLFISESYPNYDASQYLQDLKENHATDWMLYCHENEWIDDSFVGDFLA